MTGRRPGPSGARVLSLCAMAAMLAIGCVGPRAPRAVPIAAGDARPASLLAALARSGEARRGLRGVARIAIDGPAGARQARQVLLVEQPARLRVEILGLLDQRVAVLTTDGAEYQLYRAEDRSLTGGPVHGGLLWEVAGLAVSPEQAVRLLLAAPELPPGARLVAGAQLAGGEVRLDLRVPGAEERVRIDFDPSGRLAG